MIPPALTDTQEQPEEPATKSTEQPTAAARVSTPVANTRGQTGTADRPARSPVPASAKAVAKKVGQSEQEATVELPVDTHSPSPANAPHEIEWKPVEGYETLYEVSSDGQVRNVTTGKILSPWKNYNGYLKVSLSSEEGRRNHRIHRLVATAFIRPPLDDEEVNHIDFDKTNNDVTNLEWVTPEENLAHFVDANPDFYAQKHIFSDDQVLSIRERAASGESRRSIALSFGVSNETIAKLTTGQSYANVVSTSCSPSPETPQAIADDEAAQANPTSSAPISLTRTPPVVDDGQPNPSANVPPAQKASSRSDVGQAASTGGHSSGEFAQQPADLSQVGNEPEVDKAASVTNSKPDCLKLRNGHCKISFETSALCSECNRAKAEKARAA